MEDTNERKMPAIAAVRKERVGAGHEFSKENCPYLLTPSLSEKRSRNQQQV